MQPTREHTLVYAMAMLVRPTTVPTTNRVSEFTGTCTIAGAFQHHIWSACSDQSGCGGTCDPTHTMTHASHPAMPQLSSSSSTRDGGLPWWRPRVVWLSHSCCQHEPAKQPGFALAVHNSYAAATEDNLLRWQCYGSNSTRNQHITAAAAAAGNWCPAAAAAPKKLHTAPGHNCTNDDCVISAPCLCPNTISGRAPLHSSPQNKTKQRNVRRTLHRLHIAMPRACNKTSPAEHQRCLGLPPPNTRDVRLSSCADQRVAKRHTQPPRRLASAWAR